MVGSQSSSCSLCWSTTRSAAFSDEFILNMVSVDVTEKTTSCPEACHAVLDTLVLAHKLSGRLSWAITSHSAFHGKLQQSLKDGLGDKCVHTCWKKLTPCARRWDSTRPVMACVCPSASPCRVRTTFVQGLPWAGHSSLQWKLSASVAGTCCWELLSLLLKTLACSWIRGEVDVEEDQES